MEQVINTLASVHPVLPWGIITAGVWFAQWAIRKWFPDFWEQLANIPFPGADLAPTFKLARKVWQGLPSVLVGALLGAVSMGDDPEVIWKGALAGALAPVWHELLKAFPGPYKGGKPPAAGALMLLALLAAPGLQGCTGSFETARLAAPNVVPEAPRDEKHCQSLDTERRIFGAVAQGSSVLASASGLAIIPIDSRKGEIGLAIGSVVAAATAATSVYLSEAAGESWVRECSSQE